MQNPIERTALSIDEIRAIKALSKGQASEGQQSLALKAIIQKIAHTNALPYIQGSADGTNVLIGRAFVGSEIYRVINMELKEENT